MDIREKKDLLKVKYDEQIRLLAKTNDVDMGVAFDMLVANVIDGSHYPYINEEEFKKDWNMLIKDIKDIVSE